MFSRKFCKIVKDIFFYRNLRPTTSDGGAGKIFWKMLWRCYVVCFQRRNSSFSIPLFFPLSFFFFFAVSRFSSSAFDIVKAADLGLCNHVCLAYLFEVFGLVLHRNCSNLA